VLFYDVIHYSIPEEVNVVTLSPKGKKIPFYIKLFNFIRFTYKYSEILKEEKINISISFLPIPNFINGMIAMRHKKIKTILSERSYPSNNPKNKTSLYISKIFYPILYNRCDKSFSN
jgi:UDP-N-acetylglucosamine:LPS N-acetylglucosamine transferase